MSPTGQSIAGRIEAIFPFPFPPEAVPPLRLAPAAGMRIEPVTVPVPVRLALAGDDAAVVSRLQRLLTGEKSFDVVGPWGSRPRLLFALEAFRPDVFVLGLCPSSAAGALSLLRAIKARTFRTRVVLVGAPLPEAWLLEAARLGVRGILPRRATLKLLIRSIQRVHAGGLWLMRPELHREVLWAVGQLESQAMARTSL
jgi:DNA-binding NarL/FixJ family response regulator